MENKEFVLGKITLVKNLPVEKILYPRVGHTYIYKVRGLFKCFCGKEFVAYIQSVKSGNTKSCGCYRNHKVKKALTIHGQSKSRLFAIWANIIQRCLDFNVSGYKDYGGRGIGICNEWKNSFVAFRDWALSHGYKSTLTIDRIDNNGNYEPSNCRWVTRKIQNINQRPKKNKSGFTGVNFRRGVFEATIVQNKVRKHLGTFRTAEEASDAYEKAKEERNQQYNREAML